jgi:hypothetical protein
MPARTRMESPLRSRTPEAEPASGPASSASPQSSISPDPAAPAELQLRTLTGWEEEFLEQHQYDANTARLCNEVLARCMTDPGADHTAALAGVREMLVPERDRALIELRRISLGPGVSAQVDCTECGQVAEVSFSLDALAAELPAVPRVLPADVPGSPVAHLRLPTAGDQEDLLDETPDSESARLTWMIGRCLLLDGARAGEVFARSLPVKARRELQEMITRSVPQLDLEMAVTCPHCAAPMVAPFDVQSFFFRIERSRRGFPGRCAPAGAGLPLERARHPRAVIASPARLPAAARSGRQRLADARPAGREPAMNRRRRLHRLTRVS